MVGGPIPPVLVKYLILMFIDVKESQERRGVRCEEK